MSSHPVVQKSANTAAQFLLKQEQLIPGGIDAIRSFLHREIPRRVDEEAAEGHTDMEITVYMDDHLPSAMFDHRVSADWRAKNLRTVIDGVKEEFMTKWGGSNGEGLTIGMHYYNKSMEIRFDFEASTKNTLFDLRKEGAGSSSKDSIVLDEVEEKPDVKRPKK